MVKRTMFPFLMLFFVFSLQAALPVFPHYYFFGDSLSDAGNYVEQKPKDCVRVNAPVTNNTSNTAAPVIWASTVDAGFNATPSKQGGNDWAIAGSETDKLTGEVQSYLSANRVDPDALYVVWIGANDVIEKIYDHPSFHGREKTIASGMTNIAAGIDLLYQHGARNFLVIGMPDISITPFVSAPFTIKGSKYYIGLFHLLASSVKKSCFDWNAALFNNNSNNATAATAPLAYLALHDPDIRIYTWNPAPLLDDLAQNPARYGFPDQVNGKPNNQVALCMGNSSVGNPDDYIFYNYIHPSERAHMTMAKKIREDAELFSL